MSYRAAISYLYALSPRGMELGLGRMEQALALRGHPERACPSILVGGTNGKGSVATMIATVLASAGHKVGLFTSPHLHRFVERFRIDGRPVAERTIAHQVAALRPFLDAPGTPRLTFFETATLLAFELFRDACCDVMVLEVGLGGRLDATNVVTPLLSVITSVALDHTAQLGPTVAHVAREKAGIVKPGVPVVVGVRDPDARAVIARRARRIGAPLLAIGRDFRGEVEDAEGTRQRVVQGARQIAGLRLPLAGSYQADNLACAVAALWQLEERFGIDARALRRGLRRVRWPGRLERIEGTPALLLDAAHNPHAAEALARHLVACCGHYRRRVLVFGSMRDKEHDRMLACLRPCVDAVVFTQSDTSRAEPARALAARYGGEARDVPASALARARKLAGKRGLVIACGSIFVMAAVRAEALGVRADPPIAL